MRPCFLILPLFLALLVCSGCISTRKYKLAADDTPPPTPLEYKASQPPLEAVLHTVIIYKGPGSWKREAWWDEYVVSIVNRGETPIVIESAVLTDFRGEALSPGSDPWGVDRVSRQWWKEIGRTQTATQLELGASRTLLVAGQAAMGTASVIVGVGFAALGGSAAVGVGALAWPVYAVTAVAINSGNRKKVEAEFVRRRLELPRTLPAGQTGQGSFFFRVAPGPRRLTLRCSAAERVHEVVIDLSPLAGLHLKSDSAPAAARSRSPGS